MMALFPAYAQDLTDVEIVEEGRSSEPFEVSPGREMVLLASDSGTDDERPTLSRQKSQQEYFYWDTKSDCGNLRVSTLYYPGRPQYTLSANPWGCGGGTSSVAGSMTRRYYHAPVADAPAHRELHERAAAYRRMLADQPCDQDLWLQYIDFQEQWSDGEAALRAAEEAVKAVGRGACGVALRCTAQRLRAAHLPRDRHLALLRDDLAAAQSETAAWARLAAALGAAGTRAPALAAAALPRLAHAPLAYPHLLYIHGATLRAAGLWEQLVLLMELVTAMNFPPAGFPPPHDEARQRDGDAALLAAEDKATRSGLPLSAVWVRVERARAAAHWRPAREPDADPQRCPLPADVADLLLPAAGDDAAFLLCVNLLRLAKVPLMPQSEYVSRACGIAGLTEEEVGGAWWCADAEALLPMFRAARRLPPAHPACPASPAVARSLLAHFLDPPHYFTDENGYLGWVSSLWDACCSWTSGARRVALLCWRLRWLHALVLLLEHGEAGGAGAAEARRVRGEARAALKRFAGESPLPFALFARLEAALQPARALAAAHRALRAALADAHCPATHRLYVARVLREVSEVAGGAGGAAGAWGAWAVPCAVLGRALPDEDSLRGGARPGQALLDAALLHCGERCGALEEGFGGAECAWSASGALAPGAAEWGAARAALAGPARRRALRRLLPAARARAAAANNAEGLRYYEQSACALATARDGQVAGDVAELADLFPHNALLALGAAGAPLWRRGRAAGGAARGAAGGVAGGAARSHAAALAHALPALLRAAAADWAPREAERAHAACVRAARRGAGAAAGAGGALLAGAALEAAARAPRASRPHRALLAALDTHPDHKWLYVRGAAWVPAEADALADVLLERQLRLHALRDELLAPQHDAQQHPQHHQHHAQRHTQ